MKRRHTLLAALLALVVVATACGGDDGGGGEADGGGEPITIGGLFDLTGATSDVGVPYSEGVRGYVEWRNANGGVADRSINLVWEDYAYDVAIAEQVYSRLKSEGVVAIQGWGTGDTEALRGRVNTDEIPFMSASYAETLTDPAETPYNFVVGTSYSDQMRIALQWISQEAGGHAEVAVFHHDSPFGEAPLEDGGTYIDEEGLDIGYETYAMPAEATDYVSELSQARDQGATHIVVQNVSTPAATLARDVQQAGLDVQIVCLNWCADELFIDLAGPDAEGVVGALPFSPTTADAPGLEEPAGFLEEEGSSLEEATLHYSQGWYTMAVLADALEAVVEEGGELDGPAVKEALESLPPFETGGVTAPIDFAADSHKGMPASKLFQVDGGAWTELTDFMSP
jgi:branched-chain amino acid transport system substrate-binding protein